jgi:hypothetical protein
MSSFLGFFLNFASLVNELREFIEVLNTLSDEIGAYRKGMTTRDARYAEYQSTVVVLLRDLKELAEERIDRDRAVSVHS